MKKMPLFALFLSAQVALCSTLSVDFIIAKMAEHCIAADNTKFKAVITKDDNVAFSTLTIKRSGFFIGDFQDKPLGKSEGITLYFLDELTNCTNNKQQAEKLKEYLRKTSVNLAVVTQGLFNFEPIFIIGAQPNDLRSPQLWIIKDSFLPAREMGNGRVVDFAKWTVINSNPSKKIPQIVTTNSKNKNESIAISEIMP